MESIFHCKKLGFGLMRLPQKDGAIDIEQTKAMVDRFMAAGFTYFDTAWAYPGSEDAMRRALVERYPRESYTVATKAAVWIGPKDKETAQAQLATSLRQGGLEYIDYYLLHNLGEQRTHWFDDFDMWSFVQQKKREGVIRHVGFSFHSTPEELDAILTAHPEMEFVQLQINYADWENPAVQSRRCYEVARRHGKSVIVMEPVKGGLLAEPPERVQAVLKAAEPGASCASWAIRFAADLEGVATVLSGMSSLAQMEDNLSYMTDFSGLSDAQRATLEKARAEMAKIPLISCTTCDYCAKVCPMDVGISGSFTAMNLFKLCGDKAAAVKELGWKVAQKGKKSASACVKCGACEEACPQHLPIRALLEDVAETLGE